MNKGLEATKRLKWGYAITREERINLCECIEKELKQAEENEKLLNVFKNALTIEHHEYPTIEHDHSKDEISYLVKELYTIRQSELDKDMRKALREWVLKNAFPKEIKALELIKKCFYVAKSSGAILLTDYGFDHKEELKEVLL